MESIVLDTDVVSFWFKDDTRLTNYRRHVVGKHLIVSFVTVAELDEWAFNDAGEKSDGSAWIGIYSVLFSARSIAICVGFGLKSEILPGNMAVSSRMLMPGLPQRQSHVGRRC
jgi:hypothetical protein